MAITITNGSAVTVSSNSKSSDQVTGTYQFVGKGTITLVAKSSATGMYATLLVGGVALMNDQPIIFTGTSGTCSVNDNVLVSQLMNGGRVEFYLRNSTASSISTDFTILFG